MLHALSHNKAGRSFTDSIDWRTLFSGSEDALTSAVFGNLFHLPPALFWQLLQGAFRHLSLPVTANTELQGYEFWPRWNATGTRNAYNVEPDVFIRTSDFDLIVEAKRYDYAQHDSGQWQTEFIGYLNEYGTGKNVFVLAVGGLDADDVEPELIEGAGQTTWVYKCRWCDLLASVSRMRSDVPAPEWGVANVLADIMTGFSLHGFAVTDWFCTLPVLTLRQLRQGQGMELLLRESTLGSN